MSRAFSLFAIIIIVSMLGFIVWGSLSPPSGPVVQDVPETSDTVDPLSGILKLDTPIGQGSCFVVAKRGEWVYAVTVRHVLRPGMSFTIDGITAEIVRVSTNEDLALVRFRSSLSYKIYRLAREVKIGEPCRAIGWRGNNRFVYRGYVVAVDYKDQVVANTGCMPGCSGGALLNDRGEVIGVITGSPMTSAGILDSTVLFVPARFVEALIVTINA